MYSGVAYTQVCGKSFVDQEKLDFHHKVHTQSADGDFRCDQCGHVCRNWRSFVYHTQTHSGDGGKKHSCEVGLCVEGMVWGGIVWWCERDFRCGLVRARLQKLAELRLSHADAQWEGGKKHSCEMCCMVSSLFQLCGQFQLCGLIVSAVRGMVSSLFQQCGHTLSSLQRLQHHRGNHRRGLHFCCFDCGKLFRTEVDLARHAVKHSKSPPPPLVHPHPAPAGVTPLPAASPTSTTTTVQSRQRPEDPSLTRPSVVLARATRKRVNEAGESAESSSPVPQQTPTLSSKKGGDGELLKDSGSVKKGDLGSSKEDRGLSQDLGSLRETVAEPSALGRKV
ncbi:hypothetical protein ACOMHN_066329 [Nucella lapillus]